MGDLVDSTYADGNQWVASKADGVYFRRSCAAAQDLAPTNRVYFRTAQQAGEAGYRRSRVEGC